MTKEVGGMPDMVDEILVDARALQHPAFRFRGVGQHSTSLLFAIRSYPWPRRRPRLVALTDHDAEPLFEQHALLFDEVTTVRQRPERRSRWFVSLSPLTHDPVWVSDLLLDPDIVKIAVFYDLIPLNHPERYLAGLDGRADYLTGFAWLGRYDLFAAISRHTGAELTRFRTIDPSRIFVTGVAVRGALEPRPDEADVPFADRRHIVVAGGGDARKNPECAVAAHARSRLRGRFPLVVFGNYPPETRGELRSLYVKEGGAQDGLRFAEHLSDEALRQLYRHALLTVVPSRAEGFSIPIVESLASGTPVAVSDVDAHPELVGDPALRFPPGEPDALVRIFDALSGDPALWERARSAGADVWPSYTEEAVAARFLTELFARVQARSPSSPAVRRGLRPRLAVLTPLPPARSGIADYSAVTLEALSRHVDIHAFSDTPGAESNPAFQSLNSVQALGFGSTRYDATLSVLGNSDHHTGIFRYLLDNGGAALAHDARMVNFYAVILGLDRAVQVAQSEHKREVSREQVVHWVHHQHDMPVLFLSEIVRAASPLMVHSALTAAKIEELYGTRPKSLPFAQYRRIDRELYGTEKRGSLRKALGWARDDVVICSFGFVIPDKAIEVVVWALRLLHDWGIRARLVLCGSIDDANRATIAAVAEGLGLGNAVAFFSGNVPERTYTEHLMAADMAVQLRTYAMGGLSGAVNDCIVAALPTICNDHLALAMEAPSFVRRIPDALSPVLLAEAALDIIASGQNRDRPVEEARAFALSHSPDAYARAIAEALGFDRGPA